MSDRDQRRSSENERSDRRKEYRELEGRVEGSCRKRQRYEETFTYARPDRTDDDPNRVQRNRSSPRDYVKRDSDYDKRHHDRTSVYPYHSSSDQGRRRDTPYNERCSTFGSVKRPQTFSERSSERYRYSRSSYANRDKTSTESNFTRAREREREERNRYRDRSPRSTRRPTLQLPVDRATSTQQRHEVVPYASSEANSTNNGSREHHITTKQMNGWLMRVPSVVDSGLVPSQPEKYYSIENDQVILESRALPLIIIIIMDSLLLLGG